MGARSPLTPKPEHLTTELPSFPWAETHAPLCTVLLVRVPGKGGGGTGLVSSTLTGVEENEIVEG